MILPAFAKINLFLRVYGRRADGFHEVETVLQTVSLKDNLVFSPREDTRLELTCDDSNIPNGKNNLILRAAVELQEAFSVSKGADIRLIKRIPVAAGLGGASSNAAVTLLALSSLWQLPLSRSDFEQIGTRIGSDVPFFFTGGTAYGRGTGASIEALPDLPARKFVIVAPGIKVLTAEAYKALNAPALTSPMPKATLFDCGAEAFSSTVPRQIVQDNDFESVISQLFPEVKRAREALLRQGASKAMLCGSGSSVFGIFENDDIIDEAIAGLSSEKDWQVFRCHSVSRADYQDAYISRL